MKFWAKTTSLLALIAALMAAIPAVQARPLLLYNADIRTADDRGRVPNGQLLIDDGVIQAIGAKLDTPSDAEMIDLEGAVVTPGFILSNSTIGLVEVSSRANANDASSSPDRLSAGIDVQYAINGSSILFPEAWTGGVTRAIVTPGPARGTNGALRFGGQPAVARIGPDGITISRSQIGVVLYLGGSGGGRTAAFPQLLAMIDDVKRFSENPELIGEGNLYSRQWVRADLEALRPVVAGEKPLIVFVERASDILALLSVKRQTGVDLILVGAAEGWKVASQISAANVPVLLDPTTNLPRTFDQLDASLANPSLLAAAGVKVAIIGSVSGHDARLIRYFAGLSVANGLSWDLALKAITTNAATIFGLDRVGKIAPGYVADLAIWSGDPFEPLSNLKALYVEGEPVSLDTRQAALRDKYLASLRADTDQESDR